MLRLQIDTISCLHPKAAWADSRKDYLSNQKLKSHNQTDHQLLKRLGTKKGVTGLNGQSFHKRLKSQEKGGQPWGSNMTLTARAVTFQPL